MGDAFKQVSEQLGELVESFFTTPIFGDKNVGFTVTTFWFFIALIVMLVAVFTYLKKMKGTLVPHGVYANGFEFIIDFIKDDICKGTLGDTWRKHFPFIATVFFVVMFGDFIGMLPFWKAGTGTMGITCSVAVMSFVYFIYVGMRAKGVFGYIKSLAPAGLPAPLAVLVWVIEVFSTFLRLMTLSVRLFCNMFAGHVVMGVFAIMCTIFCTPITQGISALAIGEASMSILWMVLLILLYVVELLVAFIQAYIFALLSAVYVQLAEAQEH